MLPRSENDTPFYTNVPTRFSHVISYVDFNQYSQDNESHVADHNNKGDPLASSVYVQRVIRQETQPPPQTQPLILTPRHLNSSLIASTTSLKDTTITFANEKDGRKPSSVPIDDDVKQSRTDSTPPAQVLQTIITTERSQQTSFVEMSFIDEDDDENNNNNTLLNDDDSLVVCEQNRCQLLLFTPQLTFYSTCDGMRDGDPYEFDSPWNVTAFLDRLSSSLLVADTNNRRVQYFSIENNHRFVFKHTLITKEKPYFIVINSRRVALSRRNNFS